MSEIDEIPQQSDEEVWEAEEAKMLAEFREANPEAAKQISGLANRLERTILSYLRRPDSDPKIIDLFHDITSSLDSALH